MVVWEERWGKEGRDRVGLGRVDRANIYIIIICHLGLTKCKHTVAGTYLQGSSMMVPAWYMQGFMGMCIPTQFRVKSVVGLFSSVHEIQAFFVYPTGNVLSGSPFFLCNQINTGQLSDRAHSFFFAFRLHCSGLVCCGVLCLQDGSVAGLVDRNKRVTHSLAYRLTF